MVKRKHAKLKARRDGKGKPASGSMAKPNKQTRAHGKSMKKGIMSKKSMQSMKFIKSMRKETQENKAAVQRTKKRENKKPMNKVMKSMKVMKSVKKKILKGHEQKEIETTRSDLHPDEFQDQQGWCKHHAAKGGSVASSSAPADKDREDRLRGD